MFLEQAPLDFYEYFSYRVPIILTFDLLYENTNWNYQTKNLQLDSDRHIVSLKTVNELKTSVNCQWYLRYWLNYHDIDRVGVAASLLFAFRVVIEASHNIWGVVISYQHVTNFGFITYQSYMINSSTPLTGTVWELIFWNMTWK